MISLQRFNCDTPHRKLHHAITPKTLISYKLQFYAVTYYATCTHTFNGPFSGTTQVSRYQARDSECSGISWAVCKSAPLSRQITMPAPHHSVFYRPDALPATQTTSSKH